MVKPNAVIYIRVSDPSQIENNSLETQLKSCQGYAKENNYEVVRIFREEGASAKHIHTRPEMRSLLEFCTLKKNQISAVIIYKMDRWTRNTEEGLVTISLLARYGITLLPSTEISTQDSMGYAMRTILMTLGELDNNLKGERVRDNMKTMFKNGYWCWKPRLGYRRPYNSREENRGKPPIPDGRLSEIIKALFLKAAETSVSKKYLAEYANNHGFKEVYGSDADGRTITRILSDTFYYGYMYAPKWKDYAWGKHKPLVDQSTWERANINVFGRKGKYSHQDSSLFPLKGSLLCSGCNHNLTSSNPRGTSKTYLYYECHSKGCLNRQRVGADKAHSQFTNLLQSIRPSERVLKLFTHMVFDEWDKGINQRKNEAKILDERISELENRLTAIAESNSKHILSDEEASVRAETVRKDISVLRIERSDIRIDQYETEAVRNFTEEFLLNLDKLWKLIDLPHKLTLQNGIFSDKLLVKNGEIQIISLASTFKLIGELNTQNVDLVTPMEFESMFSG